MRSRDKALRILGIGAHFDDIELNALGTILRAKTEYSAKVYALTCTNSAKGGNQGDRLLEQGIVNNQIGYELTFFLDHEDGSLQHNTKLTGGIEKVMNKVLPDLIITHSESDFHQDHVAVAKAVRAANRYSLYSVISFASQDPKQPFLSNLHVDITDYFDKKLNILKFYTSQQDKPWLCEETIRSRNAGIGGMKHAEKFYVEYMKV